MAEVYALAVMRGNRKFSSVPKIYQSTVKKILKTKVDAGQLSEEEYKILIKE